MFLQYSTTKNGYGKRPLWQWVALYLVIGAIIYGVVYYAFIAPKGGYKSNTMQQQNTPQNSSAGY